jgi:hypothetical protein
LQVIVGGAVSPPILVDYGVVAGLALGIVFLVLAAGLVDAVVARRGGLAAVVRIGGE